VTSRIYYTDPYCRRFEAVVTAAFEHEGRPAMRLDRTAFYPTSGGQPFDRGRLGGVDVVEVLDVNDDVVHVLSAPLTTGAAVTGEIDWGRRFDHMQQHTRQHVLSAAFDRLFDTRTVSFHLGADVSTIDLAREMSWEQITSRASAAVVLFSATAPVSVVVARSPDLSFDANAVVRALVERFGGRGGGKADLAQGGGLVGDPTALVTFARALLSVS